MWMEILDGGRGPKRGDLVQSAIGTKRERTWIVLSSVRIKRREASALPRYRLKMLRWWDVPPETRMRLYRWARSHGGQGVFWLQRYPAKKKKRTFEDYMRRVV